MNELPRYTFSLPSKADKREELRRRISSFVQQGHTKAFSRSKAKKLLRLGKKKIS